MDCSGKTTQAKLLEGNLTAKEYKVLYLREPGGTRIGEKVREILLSPTENICERAELLLFLASRAQMTEEIIIPELKKKRIVISDRFADSSVVYQGMGRNLGKEIVKAMNNFAIKSRLPDITFLIDISVNEFSSRMLGKKADRLESADLSFHECVRDGYLEIAKEYPERFFLLNGEKNKEELEKEILKKIEELL